MTQSDQTALLPSVQRRNILFVILDGIAIGLISAGGSFISVLVIRLGASPLWVSLLSSIPAAIALSLTIPWSRFVEGRGRPQAILAWARLVGYLVYLPMAVLPFFLKGETAARAIVILWSLTAIPGSLTNIMFTLVMGHAVPPNRRSFLMSRRWLILGLAQSLALPLVSWLNDHLTFPRGYQVVFVLNVLVAFWSFFCTNQIQVDKHPTRRPARDPRRTAWAAVQQHVAEIWAAKPFLIFLISKVMYNLGLAMVGAIITIYWVKHLKFSDIWVGYMTTTSTVATLVSYLPWVRVKYKIGTWNLAIVAVLGGSLYPALLTLAGSPLVTLPVVAFNGIMGAALNLAFFDSLLEVCPPDREEFFVAVNAVAVNLTGVIGPPIGAALLSGMDIRWVLRIGSLVALAGVAAFVGVGVRKRKHVARAALD